MKNKIFVSLILCLLVIPLIGTIVSPTTHTTEKKELAAWPSLISENQWNKDYLAEAGQYFEDHFFQKQNLVTINSKINTKLFHHSPIEKVICGTDQYLYFNGTLNDYLGQNVMSEREMYCVIHNMEMMSQYAESQGTHLIFTIAPNKNSLFDEHMPSRYLKASQSNIDHFHEKVNDSSISYANLFQLFADENEDIYFKRDSHWKNKGALLAYNYLLDFNSIQHETYENIQPKVKKDHVGDLDEMIFPSSPIVEENQYYDDYFTWNYKNKVENNMDPWIETYNPSGQGSVLMYRDSFGEALLPLFANTFENGYFSRLLPYNLFQIESYHPDIVYIECVQRNLNRFIQQAAFQRVKPVPVFSGTKVDTNSVITTSKEGSFYKVGGTIDEKYLEDNSDIYVCVEHLDTGIKRMYPVFYTNEGTGYEVYLLEAKGKVNLSTYVVNKNDCKQVSSSVETWN